MDDVENEDGNEQLRHCLHSPVRVLQLSELPSLKQNLKNKEGIFNKIDLKRIVFYRSEHLGTNDSDAWKEYQPKPTSMGSSTRSSQCGMVQKTEKSK